MVNLDVDLGEDLGPDLTDSEQGGGSGGVSTCPDIVGTTSLLVTSEKTPTAAAFVMRQGDTQPPLSLQILDGNGEAVVLTGAVVTACFVIPGQSDYVQQSVMTVQTDTITAKYERLVDDFVTLNAGRYYFVVTARWEDGTGISCPDGAEAVIVVNPMY